MAIVSMQWNRNSTSSTHLHYCNTLAKPHAFKAKVTLYPLFHRQTKTVEHVGNSGSTPKQCDGLTVQRMKNAESDRRRVDAHVVL